MVAGCATRKPTPPPPTFPATLEPEIRELHALPQGPYERLEIVTVAAEIGEQLAAAIKSARDSAAQKGANVLVVLHDTEFQQRVGKQRLSGPANHLPGNSPRMMPINPDESHVCRGCTVRTKVRTAREI